MLPGQCTDDFLDGLSLEGDQAADEVASRYLRNHEREPATLFREVVATHHLTVAVQDAVLAGYLGTPVLPPPWACSQKLEAGVRFFDQWGLEIGLGLLCFSLPAGYAAASFAQVLHLTGRLETDAQRRVFESARMVLDVTSPGGLAPGGRGYCTARRVRLMHAAVRQLILRDHRVDNRSSGRPDEMAWPDDWGMPISQEQLLGGILAFGWSMLSVLDRLGIAYQQDEADGWLHLWDVVAYYLGVREDLLPIGREAAELLDPLFRKRNFAPSHAGHAMTAALVDVLDRMGPDRVFRRLPVSMMRHLLGDDVARIAGVPPADWTRHLIRDLRPLMRRLSVAQLHDASLRRLVRAVFRPTLDRIVSDELHDATPAFVPPTQLAQQQPGVDDVVIDLTGRGPAIVAGADDRIPEGRYSFSATRPRRPRIPGT